MIRTKPHPRLRLVLALVAITLLPVVVWLDTRLSIDRGWSSRSAGTLGRLPGLAMLAAAMLCAFIVVSPLRRIVTQKAPALWLAVIAIMFAIGVGEWMTRRIAGRPAFHCRPPLTRYEYDPDSAVLPGAFGIAHSTTNSQGLRGAELPDDRSRYRILCLGGSATECFYIDDSESWPLLLEQRLNHDSTPAFYCAAAGYSEYATGHHWRFLDASPLLDQFECVVLMPGVNDLLRLLMGYDMGEAAPPLWFESSIAQQLRSFWNVRLARGIYYDRTGKELAARERSIPIPQRPIDMPNAVAAYGNRLRQIAETCRRRRLRLICVSQPVLWDDFLTPLGMQRLRFTPIEPEPRAWSLLQPGGCREAIDQHNDKLRETCHKLQIEFVDAADDMNGIEQYFCDDFRLSEKGCQRLAELLAAWFVAHPLPAPRPPRSSG